MIDFARWPLVDTSWLANHLDDPDVRVVDARWYGDRSSREAFRAGHIPGAMHLDWHLDLSHTVEGVRNLLLPPDAFAAIMSRCGIGDRTRVVAYADQDY